MSADAFTRRAATSSAPQDPIDVSQNVEFAIWESGTKNVLDTHRKRRNGSENWRATRTGDEEEDCERSDSRNATVSHLEKQSDKLTLCVVLVEERADVFRGVRTRRIII